MDYAYTFGPFSLFPAGRLLLEAGDRVRVGGRALDILLVLVERAGDIVSNEELMRRVWPETTVEEANLRVHIGALRKVLGETRSAKRYLVNVPSRGYCFVEPVTRSDNAAPPVSAAKAAPISNLPVNAQRIFGRQAVLERLAAQLLHQRSITLVGAGGIGKTTVAVAAARHAVAQFEEGAIFVDLASLSDPALVPSAVAFALRAWNLTADPMEGLLQHLRGKRMLIVLDNCEHVLDASARLVDGLIHATTGVVVLATSREPLRARAEVVHRLAPLEIPSVIDASVVSHALDFPAVEMFLERARASSDGFEPKPEDFLAMLEICQRLDGIPLAIELAAAMVPLFGVRGLAARLDDRFALLTRGHRTALPRQRTLRATFDWSYALLTEDEQLILRRLCVFRGAFTLEAAKEVVALSNDAALGSFTGLTNLVEKSLVAVDVSDDLMHFRLQDSTRAYALERATGEGEIHELRRRHAEHYERAFSEAESAWEGELTAQQLARTRQVDDVRSALAWAFAPSGDPGLGVRLTTVTVPLWFHLALYTESSTYVERAIAQLGGESEQDLRLGVKLHSALGTVHMNTDAASSGEAMQRHKRRALELAEQLGDRAILLRSLWGVWVSLFMSAQRNAALPYAERFLEVAEREPESGETLIGERLIAVVAHTLGDQRRALTHIERLVSRPLPPRSHVVRLDFDQRVTALAFYARILWLMGRIDEAQSASDECLREAERLDHAPTLFYALANGACIVAAGLAELDTLTHVVRMMLATTTKYGPWHRMSLCFDGWLSVLTGDDERGVQQLREALENKLYKPTFVGSYSAFRGILADGERKLGDWPRALDTIERALEEAQELEESWYLPELLRIKGELFWQRGDGEGAHRLFERSLALAAEQGAAYWELRCATSFARTLRSEGRFQNARDLLAPIYARFEQQAHTPHVSEARRLLGSLDASKAS